MKYILYARKSTEEDDRQVLSIEVQLVELQEYAAKEKLEIVIRAAPRLRRGFGGQAPAFPNSCPPKFSFRKLWRVNGGTSSPPQAAKCVRTNSRIPQNMADGENYGRI